MVLGRISCRRLTLVASARAVADEALGRREETCRKKWLGFWQSCFCLVNSGILFFVVVRYLITL